jgi:hypothetical protein
MGAAALGAVRDTVERTGRGVPVASPTTGEVAEKGPFQAGATPVVAVVLAMPTGMAAMDVSGMVEEEAGVVEAAGGPFGTPITVEMVVVEEAIARVPVGAVHATRPASVITKEGAMQGPRRTGTVTTAAPALADGDKSSWDWTSTHW